MNEMSLEEIKERALLQESRIAELQKKQFEEDSDELLHRDPVYDLYLEDDFLYLNLDLPGVLDQEIKVRLQDHEVFVSGEFPKLFDGQDSEYLYRQKAFGPFEYHFLLPSDHKVGNHEWQLVHGVLQIRMKLEKRHDVSNGEE